MDDEQEEFFASFPFDRTIEQAILTMKKGAHLLKCGRRGKPKFCPFRLSTDDKYLIWYSGQDERQLRLSLVSKIVSGQKTVNFQRQLQPDKEQRSISLIYANNERSLDLICKDKAQADCWFIGFKAAISKSNYSRPFPHLNSSAGAQSCVNSPAGYLRRRHSLGILEVNRELSQVHSVCGSPSQSLGERCLSDGLSISSDGFGSSESSLSKRNNVAHALIPNPSCVERSKVKKDGYTSSFIDSCKTPSQRLVSSTCRSPLVRGNYSLKDILIWGEGVEGGTMGGINHYSVNQNSVNGDALVPRLLESTAMLDVGNISLGGKHAALVTKQGEVFCWGNGSCGKLGHKIDMDVSCPKVVESLDGVPADSVTCGEYQTFAITHSGELYMWGDNKCNSNLEAMGRTRNHWFPHKLCGPLDGVSVSNVACGDWHTAIVSSSGQLFTFGDGTFGVLGHGNLRSIFHPKEVESLKGFRVKSVACGTWHSAAIVDITIDRFKFNSLSGKLFTWGDGDKGRLGHDDVGRRLQPTRVAQLVDYDFVQVSCGRMLTVALSNTGKVYTMGSSVHGQLGNAMAKDRSVNRVEGYLKQEFVREISSGSYHVAVLTSAGNVYTWGKGRQGQLGLGDTEDRNSPEFVESLKDRKIESIACGSNLTAVISLHKSISFSDQAACSGCRMTFGFTRKKHNCYNCGLQFCNSCSGKKVVNASLALDKSKPSRVCNSCFSSLQKNKHLGGTETIENHPLSTTSLSVVECRSGARIPFRSREEKQQHIETIPSFSAGVSKWGNVTCPKVFRSFECENVNPLNSKSLISNAASWKEQMSDSKLILIEEVQRLRAEARGLEIQCEAGSRRIQQCQQNLEKTSLVAREEAEKSKAANEIIKALALRLHAISDIVASKKDGNDRNHSNLSQIASTYSCIPDTASNSPAFVLTHLPRQVKVTQQRELDGFSSSPIGLSSTLKFLDQRELPHEHSREDNNLDADLHQTGTKVSAFEWVEEYEAGVYITFTTLPGGKRGLKRVRFSRRRFVEKEAELWWEQNQVLVYQKYGIEGYTRSKQHQKI